MCLQTKVIRWRNDKFNTIKVNSIGKHLILFDIFKCKTEVIVKMVNNQYFKIKGICII